MIREEMEMLRTPMDRRIQDMCKEVECLRR
jgi:hypothetical protein